MAIPASTRHSRHLTTCLCALLGALFLPLAARAQTFSNTNPITIPNIGVASPYPSTIAVAGRSGPTDGLRVTLNGFSHTYTDDVVVLLVAPTGQKIVLMGGVGQGNVASNLTLSFATSSADPVPSPIVNGTYAPTGQSGNLNAPAPAGPYSSDLTSLIGLPGNGVWSLYVVDQVGGDAGTIAGGWTLEFLSLPLAATSGTSFTYQGKLTGADTAANLRFSVWDHPISQDPARQVFSPITRDDVQLVDGLFAVNLDFGASVPTDRGAFLGVEVSSPPGSPFVALLPRQRITPAPIAGNLAKLVTVPVVTEIRAPQGEGQNGSLTLRACGSVANSGTGTRGGTLRLIAGNANSSAPSPPPVGTSLDNNVHIIAGDNTFAGTFGTAFNGNIQFFAGDGQPERMRLVGDNGFLGIGTTDPVALLDVRGSIALGPTGQLRAVAGVEDFLCTLRGSVNISGAGIAGAGFTASRNGVGIYTVTFLTPFSSFPVVTANALNASPVYIHISTVVSNSVTFNCRNSSGVLVDSAFNFAATGPR